MTRIKICGLTRPELALAAAQAGADFFGLVFYPPSHRNVTPEQARDIVATVRKEGFSIPAVGVFVNCLVEEMNRLAEFCPLDYVQLHGDETWELCRLLHRPVIKAVRIEKGRTTADVAREIQTGLEVAGSKEVIPLLDTQLPGKYGGTGHLLDRGLVAELARRFRFLVAGGLTPQNVAPLIKEAQPWGVDVSGGVETRKVKDPKKIEAFIRAVRRAEAAA